MHSKQRKIYKRKREAYQNYEASNSNGNRATWKREAVSNKRDPPSSSPSLPCKEAAAAASKVTEESRNQALGLTL